MIRVVIADDHNLVRQGIRALLENADGFQVVGEARDGREAVELAASLKPDVMVMDINMPRLDGISAAERIRDLDTNTQVIILSMYSDGSLVRKAYRKGVKGYLLKRSVTEELLEAVRTASRLDLYVSDEIAARMDIEMIRHIHDTSVLDPINTLTPREKDVFKMVAEGMTNNAVAHELGISVKTVEKHRARLMQKMGFEDLAGLIREAIRHGLVFIED